MNYKQLTDEYLQAINKSHWVRQAAKKYGVKGSDIICELMKSGYKYEELSRMSESQYISALNKYHKWQEEGCPATELIPVEQEEQPEEKKKETKVEIKPETEGETVQEVMEAPELTAEEKHEAASLESYEKTIALLNAEIVRLQKENSEVNGLREKLHDAIEMIDKKDASINHLLMENADLKKSLYEKIQELHKKAAITPETESEEENRVMDQCTIESLSEAVERLEEENESLKKSCEVNVDVELEELKATNDLLHSKLTACEQYILNLMVYEV